MTTSDSPPAASNALEGKVILVTGAGRGIGRDVALLAAREGAAVIVNDYGGSPDGTGSSEAPAQEVIAEIRAGGGQAYANFDSVADPAGAARMVEQSIARFGRLDCVVNNAGILRDRIFHRMSHVDWTAVVDVHLMGTFNVSRAAAAYFREQGSGSFVHLTSSSALVGNFGQANYAAAKLGIVGLSKSIALDMQRFNVRSNCVSPMAWSRLAATIPTDDPAEKVRVDKLKSMRTTQIAPVIVFLASDLAREVNGQIFLVRKNEVILMSQWRSLRGVARLEGWTARSVGEHFLPAVETELYPLDRSDDVFRWDPM